MPQRFPRENGLNVRTRRESKKTNARNAMKLAAVSAISQPPLESRPSVENLEARQMLSTSYFVSTTGSDSNVGNLAAPFKTIERAATIALPGDVVQIETGVYRETVVPKHSGTASAPITFTAYKGENVTVSGANQITGWSNYNATISQATDTADLGDGNNQVFVDGKAIYEARFPNNPYNPADKTKDLTYFMSHPATEAIQSVKAGTTSAVIYDSKLTQAAGYWNGALIHLNPGQAWVDETGIVTASTPGSITISYTTSDKYSMPKAGDAFYLIGKFQTLDAAGEWYRDPTTKKLSVWTPTGDSATKHDVEVKARQDAFDLSNQHDITIQGINIFAASITTNSASKDVVINGMTATYVSQFNSAWNGWWVAPTTGIRLKGANDILENSTIAYASGDGVEVSGSGSRVFNNVIHDVNFVGADLAAIRVLVPNVTLDHNTVYNAGRDGIQVSVPHVQIMNNVVHDVGLQTTEAGGIYTVGTNGGGATMAYNTVYNIHAIGFGGTGLFLDNYTSNWNVHNNITYNVDYGLKLNFTSRGNNISNNTLNAGTFSVLSNYIGDWDGTTLTNNVITKVPSWHSWYGAGAKVSGNSAVAVGAGVISSGATGVVSTPPPVVTPPVVTPPVVTPPVVTPPVVTPPVVTPPVVTPPVVTPPVVTPPVVTPPVVTPPVVTPPVVTPPVVTPPVVTPPVVTPPVVTAPSAKKTIKAVNYTDHYKVKGDNFGGVGYAYNNDWVAYKLDFGTGVTKMSAGIAAIHANGKIEIHLGSPTGTLLGTLGVTVTGAWNKYTTQSAAITSALKGVQTVYLVFKGVPGVANINSLTFS